MRIPKRIKQQTGRHSLVDGIPFTLPVNSDKTPALMAAFAIDPEKAKDLLQGNEVWPLRAWKNAVLMITVVDYRSTDIGKYIEFSIAIGCTHGAGPAPRLLPLLLQKRYGFGQYVVDLPVSSEVSVKGGKGIWGMPKHQANLSFEIGEKQVASQYDLDGQLVMRIEIGRPKHDNFPIATGAANYCAFRGMLMKSYVYFKGRAGFRAGPAAKARLYLGDHPRIQPLKALGISDKPMFVSYISESQGILDDYFENWFLSFETPPAEAPEGLESVINLGLSEEWLAPPSAAYKDEPAAAKGAGSDE